jgi:hypothetical protein
MDCLALIDQFSEKLPEASVLLLGLVAAVVCFGKQG